ncbi:MAG: hypothetical protein KBA66_02295 [Leptospiraceae bacterium]|nr:hypothetical protein [Leptospiraceae bacterium]
MAELSYNFTLSADNLPCGYSCRRACQTFYPNLNSNESQNCKKNCEACWGVLNYPKDDCNPGGFNLNNFNILRSNGF